MGIVAPSGLSGASSGARSTNHDISDFAARAQAYVHQCVEARRCADGSLLPPRAFAVGDQMPVTRELVGRKTLNPRGDYYAHTCIKSGARARSDSWVLANMAPSSEGKLPVPPRPMIATWAIEATLAIPKRIIVRSFVATRTLRACDYSADVRREFKLDELEGGRLPGDLRLCDVIDDDELLAQVEEQYDSDEEEAWLTQRKICHPH